MSSNAADIRDEQILQNFKDGDAEAAMRTLMAKYQERLYWQIRRIVIEHADANDVIQNTLIKVYRNLGNFKGDAALFTWLYRIATNEALTYMKKKNRRSGLSIDNEELGLNNTLKAESHFDGNAAVRILEHLIDALPEKQQIVFKLRYYEEMSYKEMSGLLDTSEGALKASYHHAVKKIEAALKAQTTDGS